MKFSKTYRKIAFLGFAAIGLIITSLTSAMAQSGPEILVRGGQYDTYSRMVIDFPIEVPYRITNERGTLRLEFDADFVPDFSGLPATQLQQIISTQVSYDDGATILEIDTGGVKDVRHFRSGTFVVFDVYVTGEAENGVAGTLLTGSRRPVRRQTAANQQQQQSVNEPQTAPQQLANTANTAQGDQNTVAQNSGDAAADQTQSQPADVADNQSQTPPVQTGQEMGQQQASIPQQTPQSTNDEDATDAADTPAQAGQDTTEAGQQTPVEQSDANGEQQGLDDEGQSIAAIGSSAEPTQSVIDENLNPVDAGVALEDLEITDSSYHDEGAQIIGVTVSTHDSGIALTFPFQEEISAAAFTRGGFLWVVFDKPYKFNTEGLVDAGDIINARLRSLDIQDNPDALVMRMSARANQNLVIEKQNLSWVINLKDSPAKPRFPMRPARRVSGSGGQHIFIPASDIGRKVELEDPAVGDFIIVMPMKGQGRGVADKYSYASAEVLETAQGIAITPFSDDVIVERFTDGIAIVTSSNGIAGNIGLGDDMGFDPSDLRLVDFRSWRIGQEWEYRKHKARLLYELSLRPDLERNPARWKLAKYYLAHGRAAETIGVLEMMLDEDPSLVSNADYLAVRGIASYMLGRYDSAEKDLSHNDLDAEQDADLWRVLIAEAQGRFEDALNHYRRGKDVIGTYDEDDKAEIQLAVIRSAIALGRNEQAIDELELLRGLELSEDHLNESLLHRAELAEAQAMLDDALIQFDDLADAPQRYVSSRARYARVSHGLKTGDLSELDAIDQLERLRYAWRGDRFEVDVMNTLADLYFKHSRYKEGLELLRQGVTYFPEVAREKRMSLRMGETFRELFLDGVAEDMTPISAIGLFYEFRELTPLGNDGDQMIRRLADRLVSVDLLKRAAELLEYQVTQRLEGAARALVAANLAKIHILDENPQKAMEYIRSTREPRLPDDIVAERRHVEARALIELDRFEEAEVLLENDFSGDAELMRSDIYWGGKDWPRLIRTNRRLLGDGWRRNASLSTLQRLHLIRMTIAMTFTEDRAGLIELRRRYSGVMGQGEFSRPFELLTNDQRLTGRELGQIASQIASVEKLQSFMRDYRSDFSGR